MSEMKQEHTFKRFGASEDGSRWDLTDVVDEHSEHIEELEARLECQAATTLRLVLAIGRLFVWQRDVIGELSLSLGIDLTPEDH